VTTDPGRRPGRGVLAASATVVVVVLVGLVYDVATVVADHRAGATLAATARQLKVSRYELAGTRSQTAAATATGEARRQATTRTLDEIGTARRNLAAAGQTDYFQTLDIATLKTCLTGVSTAVGAIGAADLQGAVDSITQVSSACRSLDGSSGGLAYPFDFPDPFILPVGAEYYAFATNSAAGNIQIIESTDLTHWTTVGDALPHEASWATPGATWGPSVLQRGSTYVLYYSSVYTATGEQCISEAVATQPQGPYVDSSQYPLECQVTLGGSIDPSPFVGADGNPYLTWKSQGANGQPATLWVQQLTADGTAVAKGTNPTPLLAASLPWQGGIVEGPDMVVSGGRYVLLYSANHWQTADYAIGAADCSGPLGPCTETSDQPLMTTGPASSGPGGPSVFTDTQGQLWLAFHAWLPGRVGYPNSRPLFIRRLTITAGLPQVGL
jgi:hypothetical protein